MPYLYNKPSSMTCDMTWVWENICSHTNNKSNLDCFKNRWREGDNTFLQLSEQCRLLKVFKRDSDFFH